MCGIAGIVHFDGQPVRDDDLVSMHRAMSHRGPDGAGLFGQDNVGLAHCRLAIIDPRAGIQPFCNDDRSIVLTYNGEVYNYLEIRHALAPTAHFTTQSDTEAVLRAYERWGIGCLEHFRGMFAFALYDSRKRLLYLVRDRVGIKPLYYYHTPERLLFASELHVLLQRRDVKRDIVPESLSGYFRYQYVPTPATIYKNLYKLEPGHYLQVETHTGKVTKHQYWNLRLNITSRTETEWLEQLNAVLDDTIRLYVRSDVPFGAFLSGGVDSSLVTALMAQYLDEPARTFTIGFHEEAHSELPFAAQASRIIQTKHHEKVVSAELAEDIVRRLVVHFGEPFADSSAIPTYYVSREAAQQVKMVLSGDGGDELFGGYVSYQTTFADLQHSAGQEASALLRFLARCPWFPTLQRRAYARSIAAHQLKHDAARQIFNDQLLPQLLQPHLPIAPAVTFDVDLGYQTVDPLTYFQAQDFKTYLVDDVLTKVDRMSMANSLEVRVPLLDHKVVELAFTLPLSLKLRLDETTGALQTKYLLKKSAARFYPETFLARPKQGFGIPIVEWCKGPLRPLIEEGLRDAQNPIFDWIRYPYTQDVLNAFLQGKDALVVQLWFIFMFDLWSKHVHQAQLTH